MFGLSNKPTRLEIVEEYISSLQHKTGILNSSDEAIRDRIRDLESENKILLARIQQLETSQKQLRDYIIRMGECFKHDKPIDKLDND